MSKEANILLRHLPEIYQDQDSAALRTLLTAFDEVLFGTDEYLGLEQRIAGIPNLFNPKPGKSPRSRIDRTPREFLPWLAQWVALEHVQAMPEEQQRRMIASIVPLYALRGTKKYLSKLLTLFFPNIVFVINDEALPTMTVGESRIGKETRLGGDIPFYFYVKLLFPGPDSMPTKQPDEDLLARIRSVIDSAKPAHTAYQLEYGFEEYDKNVESISAIE